MTDGEKSKSKQTIHSRGSNKVGALYSTVEEAIESFKEKEEGPSPIHLFAINGDRMKLQEVLRNRKCDINEVDQLGRTPLVYSVLGDRIECVAMLLKAGADINIADIDERTALHWAAYQGNHKLVKLLLSKGADKVRRDKEGRTPLHLSTSHENIKVMEALLRSMKEDINLDDNNKVTPLCWSVFYDRITYTRLLLKHGADPSIMDKESRTVLHWTSQNKDPSILKLLIEVVETLINWPDCQGRTVLHMTIGRSNISLVQFLLTVPSIDINVKDSMGRTPLHWAAVLGNTDIVSLLLEKGANHTVSDNNGVFPLHYAAQTDSHETVVAMLDKEGIKDLPDNEHGTALMWAAVKGSDKVLEILLEKNCSEVNAVDAHMQTALHKCTQSGHLSCVKILIKHGAEVNVYDTKHHIPLFYACASGHGEIVKELLSNGSSSNLDNKDYEGRCPIHYAAMVDRTDIIKILLEHHSNANTQDNDGCTPLHFASFLGFVHCISVLLENGASVNLQDNVGRTALHLACRSGSVDAVKLLVSRFNASINVFAHEEEQLTPLDYAILEDHQDVAFYLQTENDAYTAIALKELAATTIQSVWKGYNFRKSFKPHKHLLVKHEIERKNTFDGSNNNALVLNCETESNNHATLLLSYESGKLPSDNDSQSCPSRTESKSRSNISSTSCNTVSSNSSVFLPQEKSRSYDSIHKPRMSINENSTIFDGLSISSPSKQVKGVRKISNTANRNFQEHLTSKRSHKNSTNSLHSYSRYHQSHSPVSSSSSSDLFTNNTSKKNDERNNLFNKSYSRYISESKEVIQSSSSESSILFDSRPTKPIPNYVPQSTTVPKQEEVKQKTSITKNITRKDCPKVRIIQPDTNLEKPWNIYRHDQKRINIIRQQTNAATKIQDAFRRYHRKKYLASNEVIPTKDSVIPTKDLVIPTKDLVIPTKDSIIPAKDLVTSAKDLVTPAKDSVIPTEDLVNPMEDLVIPMEDLVIPTEDLEDDKEIISELRDDIDIDCPLEENTEDVQEVAALFIQLAWRKYVKNKLLSEQSTCNEVIKLPITDISPTPETDMKPYDDNKNVNKTDDNFNNIKPTLPSSSSSGKQSTKTKKEIVSPPLAFIQEVYLPENLKKLDDQMITNTIIPLKSITHEPPSCKSPLRTNSTKLKSPTKSKYHTTCKQPTVKKTPIVKGMKVK